MKEHRRTVPALMLILALGALSSAAGGQSEYAAIDRHADAAPASVTQSITGLTAYLITPARSEREKVRAIYYWIARNVSYDYVALTDFLYDGKNLDKAAVEAESVLKNRKGVCGGLAYLFVTMARAAGLEADLVLGWFRGTEQFFDGRLERVLGDRPNHAWNRVKIDGVWHLLDLAATVGWAGTMTMPDGYLQGRKRLTQEDILKDLRAKRIQFKAAPEWHFFLTPPERFIYTHFPAEKEWQLLEHPRSRREFDEQVYYMPGYFKYSLELIAPVQCALTATKPLELRLKTTSATTIYAVGFPGGNYARYQVFMPQAEGDVQVFRCAFAVKGIHQLYLFARDPAQPRAQPEPALLWVVTVK